MKTLIYIPTNRDCLDSIKSYILEAQELQFQGVDCTFAVIESNNQEHVKRHAELLSNSKSSLNNKVIHFTIETQRQFLSTVFMAAGLGSSDSNKYANLLLPADSNYGAGPNKAALLASFLSIDALLRRDSDTNVHISGDQAMFPSYHELRLLGKSIAECSALVSGIERFSEDERIYCVATDYIGAAALDRDEFARLSEDLLIEHEKILYPEQSIDELYRKLKAKEHTLKESTLAPSDCTYDQWGRGEMGAIAFTRIFNYLPEMPLSETLGTDYFIRNFLYRLDYPLIYHGRRVNHKEVSRLASFAQSEQFVSYSLKDTRFKILKRIWSHLDQFIEMRLGGERVDRTIETIDFSIYAECINATLSHLKEYDLPDIVSSSADFYRRAATLAAVRTGFHADSYLEVAQRLSLSSQELVEMIVQGFRDFSDLVVIWRLLTKAAADLDGKEREKLVHILEN